MRYFVYIIRSLKDNAFYTGMTSDLERRLSEHNIGTKGTPSTLNRGPFVLVHAEELNDRTSAHLRELFWKSGIGREIRAKIVEHMEW